MILLLCRKCLHILSCLNLFLIFGCLVYFTCFPHVCIGGTRITITPLITIDQEYSDNLFLSDNKKEQDIISTFFPGISAEAKTKNNTLEFLYELGYSHYKRFSENDSMRHSSYLSALINISRHAQVQIQNNFKITEDPETGNIYEQDKEQNIISESGYPVEKEIVRRSLNPYLANTSFLSYSQQINRTDNLKIQYSHDILRNEDREIRNRTKFKPEINLNMQPVPYKLGTEWNLAYINDKTYDAVNDPGYLEESINPSFNLTYWPIRHRLTLKTGVSYQKGVTNYNSLNFDDNIFESIKPSWGMTYRFLPNQFKNFTIGSNGYYEKGITYTGQGLSDTSDDFQTWYSMIKLSKKHNRKFDYYIQYSHAITDIIGDDQDNPDYKVYEPSIGIKYILAQGVPLSLRIGYLVRDISLKGNESAITINGDLGAWKFTRYGDISFNASSGYNQDNFGAERLGFGIYYDAGFKINYIFSKYIKGQISGIYKRNRYLDQEDTRDDKTKEIRCSIGFQPEKWLFMGLDYSFRDMDSTSEQDNYKENRIILKIKYSPFYKL